MFQRPLCVWWPSRSTSATPPHPQCRPCKWESSPRGCHKSGGYFALCIEDSPQGSQLAGPERLEVQNSICQILRIQLHQTSSHAAPLTFPIELRAHMNGAQGGSWSFGRHFRDKRKCNNVGEEGIAWKGVFAKEGNKDSGECSKRVPGYMQTVKKDAYRRIKIKEDHDLKRKKTSHWHTWHKINEISVGK